MPPVVGALRPDPVTRCRNCAGEVGGWDDGVSAVLQEVDGGLGGGVWEDGDVGVSEEVCAEEGGLSESGRGRGGGFVEVVARGCLVLEICGLLGS